jgi:hypothetical protein
VHGLYLRVGIRVEGLGFRVWCLGSMVEGLVFRVQAYWRVLLISSHPRTWVPRS